MVWMCTIAADRSATGFMRKGLWIFAAMAVLGTAAPATAAATINTIATFSGTGKTVTNNAMNINDGTVRVQITSWNTTSTNLSTASARARGTLAMYDYGLGTTYSGDSSHTVDNEGRYDFILLQFNTAVALNTVTFTSGWDGLYDSDATISYANINLAAGQTYQSVGTTFWNAAGAKLQANKTTSNKTNSFTQGVVNTSRRQVNPSLVTSNVWLIAAKIGDNDTYRDAFKIKGFTYVDPYDNAGAVPEPATWAMLILGMGMVGGAMRRRNRANLALA